MLRMSAPGKLAESAEAFVSEYVDETYSRSVKALHGHLLDQAIEFVARMSLASVVFRKTHFFEQLLFVPSRDLVKRAPVLLAAQTTEQLQAVGPRLLQAGSEFGCRRRNEVGVVRDLGFFCARGLV